MARRIDEYKDELLAMYEAGMSVTKIAAELNIYPPQVYMVLDRAGVPRRGRTVKTGRDEPEGIIRHARGIGVDEQKLAYILKLFEEEGLNAREIADHPSVLLPYYKVLGILRSARVQMVPGSKRRWVEIRKKVIEAFETTDKSVDDIALEMGVQPSSGMYKIMQRMSRFRRNFAVAEKLSPAGKKEALVEEVLLRLKEEYNLDVLGRLGAGAGVQLELPIGDGDMMIGKFRGRG